MCYFLFYSRCTNQFMLCKSVTKKNNFVSFDF